MPISPTPQFTGIRLLTSNEDALQAKIELIGSAKQSLDLAYFILSDDASTRRILAALVAATHKGVKVRLLVDYLMTLRHTSLLRALSGHPNLEVRQYGPPPKPWLAALARVGVDGQRFIEGIATMDPKMWIASLPFGPLLPPAWTRSLCAVPDPSPIAPLAYTLNVLGSIQQLAAAPPKLMIARLGMPTVTTVSVLSFLWAIAEALDQFLHRTHHKLLLADGQHFIMGGRNMADAYHCNSLATGRPFVDTDLRATDSRGASPEHLQAFEELWVPSLKVLPAEPAAVLPLHLPLHEDVAPGAGLQLPDMHGQVVNGLSGEREADITTTYIRLIQGAIAKGAPCVIDIVSAYSFLDDDGTTSTLLDLRNSLLSAAKAGLTMNLRTNSLVSTDLKPVNHAFYQNVAELIAGGVHVFELRPELGVSLHTKAAAIGDHCLVIGSYNMDPRSERYDTNNLIVLNDPSGAATQAFRHACVRHEDWVELTAAAAQQLRDSTQAEAWLLRPFEQLL